jgi:hypothetical protein
MMIRFMESIAKCKLQIADCKFTCVFICQFAICNLQFAMMCSANAQEASKPQTPAAAAPAADLSVDQARLADRFKRLEEVIGRLAELSAAADPRRAELLRQAIAQSREQDLSVRFESVIKLLETERLSAASTNQTELQKELDGLLNLLLKADRDTELATQRERIRAYLKEVGRLLRAERDLRARTEGDDDAKRLAQAQQRIADDTGKLGGNITKNEHEDDPAGKAEPSKGEPSKGEPSKGEPNKGEPNKGEPNKGEPNKGEPSKGEPSKGEPSKGEPSMGEPSKGEPSKGEPNKGEPGQPGEPTPGGENNPDQPPAPPQQPADRAVQRLHAAQEQMEEAQKKLEEAERAGAADWQKKAIEALELAKGELERVLRQLREEEMDRTLTQLAARFRNMLEVQTAVYEGTLRIDKVVLAERGHDDEIESARLSRQEESLVREADKALLLLREEGSSVAFPETVEQMRDDMQQVARRLSTVDVGRVTQGLETDIMAALEETIAALEKALKNLEQNRTPPGQSPGAGAAPEPPLVEKLAELKMIRSLQVRINTRTKRYGEMIAGEQADTPELLEALSQLAKRQARVYQATADLGQRRNDQ